MDDRRDQDTIRGTVGDLIGMNIGGKFNGHIRKW